MTVQRGKRVRQPPMIEERPPETMVLYGENQMQWAEVLPLLKPVCRWIDDEGKVLIRWEMPTDIATRMGLDQQTKCASPGCQCGQLLEYDGGFLIDTNWRQTSWYFDALA